MWRIAYAVEDFDNGAKARRVRAGDTVYYHEIPWAVSVRTGEIKMAVIIPALQIDDFMAPAQVFIRALNPQCNAPLCLTEDPAPAETAERLHGMYETKTRWENIKTRRGKEIASPGYEKIKTLRPGA